jgi:hypothetical protein
MRLEGRAAKARAYGAVFFLYRAYPFAVVCDTGGPIHAQMAQVEVR